MFLYELVALLKPFEFHSDQTEEMIRRMQRPQIPESAKVQIPIKMYICYFKVTTGKLYSVSCSQNNETLLASRS